MYEEPRLTRDGIVLFLAAFAVIFLISVLASYLPTIRAARNIQLSEMMRME